MTSGVDLDWTARGWLSGLLLGVGAVGGIAGDGGRAVAGRVRRNVRIDE